VHAYDDHNRNRRRDAMEPVDSGYSAVFAEPTDTVALLFNVLIPDTTAPRVVSARALDSLHVQVELDDHVDPAAALDGVRAAVSALPDSSGYAVGIRIMAQSAFQAEQRAAEAARIAADTVAIDTTVVAPDTLAAPPRVTPARADDVDPDLPIRQLVVRLDRPLVPGSYMITLQGVTNLHGLTGTASASFEMGEPAAPAPPVPVAPDTTRARGL
jgi:hypothetical protein